MHAASIQPFFQNVAKRIFLAFLSSSFMSGVALGVLDFFPDGCSVGLVPGNG